MAQENGERKEYVVYSGKIRDVVWNQNAGKLVPQTEDENGEIIEFPIEHYNTAREFKMYTGRNVKLLVEGGKITAIKPV